ncbi:MAG: Glycosyl transferase group 1, partial [uncultured bacterium]
MKIAYLVNSYPLPSHTFIRREIRALERLGWHIHRFAMRSDRAALVDPADLEEDSRTEHLLARGLPRLLLPACAWLLRHPRRALHGVNLALR